MGGPWVGHMRHVHDGGIGWGGWVLWILLTIAFWALVIAVIVWLVRSITGRGTPMNRAVARGPAPYGAAWPGATGGALAAEQILGERFARGEIDENEYRTRLGVLRGAPPSTGVAGPGVPGGPGTEGTAPAPPAEGSPPSA